MRSAFAALAGELDRFNASVEELLRGFFPQHATDYLKLWENLLGLSADAPDKPLAQRRTTALAFYSTLQGFGSATSWQATLTRLVGTGWSFYEHVPGDGTSPPAYSLRVELPYSAPLQRPSGLTLTPSTTGGTLPAGTHYYAVTALTAYGETDARRASVATTGATGSVALSWPGVTGATGYRVFRGTAAGQEFVLAQIASGTVAYTDTGTAVGETRPPNSNQSGSPLAYEVQQIARQITPAHLDLIFGYGGGFIVGESPIGESFL